MIEMQDRFSARALMSPAVVHDDFDPAHGIAIAYRSSHSGHDKENE
jgi:hypothetical protein